MSTSSARAAAGNGREAARARRPAASGGVEAAGRLIGPSTFTIVAGPCSVVDAAQAVRVARGVKAGGATMLRGGAFKPRTDPRSFQGLGHAALALLQDAKAATGLPIVTEVLDVRDLDAVLAVADVVQVGARNMHNAPLLRALGRADRPVLLKRGLAATIDEVVKAADYVRIEGNERVILCERGIRTFETAYRFTLDLAAVPLLQQRAGLPVLVDPSHAAGRRDLVLPLSRAAAAVGADGVLVEVDEAPDEALSDGPQQLALADFAAYAADVAAIARATGRTIA
jgi:3-deoxy-7-phosphoheptulonate synthase